MAATPFQEDLAGLLEKNLVKSGLASCSICYLDLLAPTADECQLTYIFLPRLEHPLLRDVSPTLFTVLRDVLTVAKGVLWLTRRDVVGGLTPSGGMVDGLTRVLRSENEKAVIVTAALEKQLINNQAEHIMRLVQATDFGSTIQGYESSYMQIKNKFHISRAKPRYNLPQSARDMASPCQTRVCAFGKAPALRMAIESPGLLDTLYFHQDTSVKQPLAPGWVEIRVSAVGLNFKDLLLALGRENGTTFGNECAGVIHRTGAGTNFKIGERVCTFSATAFSTFTKVKTENVARVPEKVSLAHAPAVPIQFLTSWYAIHHAARMGSGESILIHSAAGGTGQAAIQIAALLGCEIFATVGSEEKKQFLMMTYRIAEDHIFYSHDTTFAKGILQLTKNRGVDVILNSLSGEELLASWDLIAPCGRFIELGKKDITGNSSLPMRPFRRLATFTPLEIGLMTQEIGVFGKEIVEKVLAMFDDGTLWPAQDFQVLPISHIQQGMRMLQSGKNIGKIVFELTDDAQVPIHIKSKASWSLYDNKTYVIAGGTGGLGVAIAEWMVKEKGARHLLLLSRSGIKKNAAQTVQKVHELRQLGAVIEAPECDIANAPALQCVLENFRDVMPQVAGYIQSSMVLKDGLFANMSYKDWRASTNPKTRGSWNLHTLLPDGPDFFVLLSSIAGFIGSAGQANYAAGNTYMDVLAHYRRARGESAVALDLGVIVDHGVLATNTELQDRILAGGLLAGISTEELLSLLDCYCDPENKNIIPP
ncbi:KR domain-containing protein [Nemania diffusa]|nr:KR domain-containing protein [Nemania diffusa]